MDRTHLAIRWLATVSSWPAGRITLLPSSWHSIHRGSTVGRDSDPRDGQVRGFDLRRHWICYNVIHLRYFGPVDAFPILLRPSACVWVVVGMRHVPSAPLARVGRLFGIQLEVCACRV